MNIINAEQQRHYMTTAPHCMIIHKPANQCKEIIIQYGDEPTNYIAPPFMGDTIEEAISKMASFFSRGLQAKDNAYRAAAQRFANRIKPLCIIQASKGDTSKWVLVE